MAETRVRTVLMRGGTSRGLFFHEKDLPNDLALRDALILRAYGSPDPYERQIDGLGGGTSLTSKVAIVGPPTHPDADVNYTFGQVLIREPRIDYGGNCGNMSSAVGPFAIDEGLVGARQPSTLVRIYNTNTRKLIRAHVPVADGRAEAAGDYAIAGVPGTGARIALEFLDPGGAVTGRLLPTGHPRDVVPVARLGRLELSVVDAANPVVFVRAADLGVEASAPTAVLDTDEGFLASMERIRSTVAMLLGLASTPEEATRRSRGVPKIAIVGPSTPYRADGGREIPSGATDLVARILTVGRVHRSYALTGGICTAVAACIPGTVVHEVARPGLSGQVVRIGHPSGVIEAGAEVEDAPELRAVRGIAHRTARRLMEGFVCVPSTLLTAASA